MTTATKTIDELTNEIATLADEMRTLGETQDSWTDEDYATFADMEQRYDAAKADKKHQQDEARAGNVKARIAALQNRSQPQHQEHHIPVGVHSGRSHPRLDVPKYSRSRLRAFRGENAVEDAYISGLWIRAALMHDKEARHKLDSIGVDHRAQVGTTDAPGGYTVPNPLSNAIIEVVDTTGITPMLCDVHQMTSDTLSVPKVVSGQTVYYPAQAAAITLSDLVFGTVALTAVKRATLTKVSNELRADSIIAIADRVAMRAGFELADRMDNEFINGDGTGTYGNVSGLIDAIDAAGKHILATAADTWAEIVLADFTTTMGLLPDKFYRGDLHWIMRRDFYANVCQKLSYAAGGNSTETLAGGTGPAFMGYPIAFTSHLPDEAESTIPALFGNFKEAAVLGDRQEVTLASSEEYAFNEDVLTIRATTRYDINVHEGGSSAPGAYVALELGPTS